MFKIKFLDAGVFTSEARYKNRLLNYEIILSAVINAADGKGGNVHLLRFNALSGHKYSSGTQPINRSQIGMGCESNFLLKPL